MGGPAVFKKYLFIRSEASYGRHEALPCFLKNPFSQVIHEVRMIQRGTKPEVSVKSKSEARNPGAAGEGIVVCCFFKFLAYQASAFFLNLCRFLKIPAQ